MAVTYVRNVDGVFEKVGPGGATTDTTLSQAGKPADAAAVGNALTNYSLLTHEHDVYAPAGYGLGETAKEIAADDTSACNGFIYTENVEDSYGYWGHQSAYQGYGTQFVSSLENRMAIRYKYSGDWYDWEYINPRMANNVEYRTTERYLSKPVYVKTINYGVLGEAGTTVAIPLNISGTITKIVDFTLVATKTDGSAAYKFPWYSFYAAEIQVTGYFDINSKAFMLQCIGDQSDKTAVLTVKYTKD